eukprot:3041244-Rhodomonas_salina.1
MHTRRAHKIFAHALDFGRAMCIGRCACAHTGVHIPVSVTVALSLLSEPHQAPGTGMPVDIPGPGYWKHWQSHSSTPSTQEAGLGIDHKRAGLFNHKAMTTKEAIQS